MSWPSFATPWLDYFPLATHGLRRELHSVAASRLARLVAFHFFERFRAMTQTPPGLWGIALLYPALKRWAKGGSSLGDWNLPRHVLSRMLVLMPTLERSTQAGEKRAVWGPRAAAPKTWVCQQPLNSFIQTSQKRACWGRRPCPSQGRVEVRVFQPFSSTLTSGGGIQDLKKRAGSANGMLNMWRLSG